MKFLRYLPLLLLFGIISLASCSDSDDPVQEPTTTIYKANLYLKSWHDSTKVATELPHIEDTFLKYLGANTLKSFSISEGSEGVNDAAVLRQCQLAAAVLDNEEYDGAYVFSVVKAETNDTLFVFEPTPSNNLSDSPLDGMAHDVLPDDDNQRPVNYYICDVAVSAAGSASNAQVELTNRGYSVVTSDLNDGVGGDYVYIGIKYSTNIYDAISAFYIVVDSRINGNFSKDGATFSPVSTFGNNYGSLNSDTGGTDMWLYATKDGKNAATSISIVEDKNRLQGEALIKGLNRNLSNWDGYAGVDINTNAGGKYRYLRVVFSDAKKAH